MEIIEILKKTEKYKIVLQLNYFKKGKLIYNLGNMISKK